MKRATVRLACDGPDCTGAATRQGKVGQSVDELREKLAEVGWRSAGDSDLCPSCVGRGYVP